MALSIERHDGHALSKGGDCLPHIGDTSCDIQGAIALELGRDTGPRAIILAEELCEEMQAPDEWVHKYLMVSMARRYQGGGLHWCWQ